MGYKQLGNSDASPLRAVVSAARLRASLLHFREHPPAFFGGAHLQMPSPSTHSMRYGRHTTTSQSLQLDERTEAL